MGTSGEPSVLKPLWNSHTAYYPVKAVKYLVVQKFFRPILLFLIQFLIVMMQISGFLNGYA